MAEGRLSIERAGDWPPPLPKPPLPARLLALDPSEASFAVRGFPDTPARPALEAAGGAFLDGYNLAVTAPGGAAIAAAVEARPRRLRGFFAEGAAMGAALRSLLPIGRSRLRDVLAALDARYVHLAYVGVGWAVARLPWLEPLLTRPLQPMLAPLAVDGRGFHDGFFGRRRAGREGLPCRGELNRIYDQGYGRSLWFSRGADVPRIAACIHGLPPERQGDFWAGVGLACVYAGGVAPEAADALAQAAGAHRRWLCQGAAFAVAAHHRAGPVQAGVAERAGRLTGRSAPLLARLAAEAQAQAEATRLPQPQRYQLWRRLIAETLSSRQEPICR